MMVKCVGKKCYMHKTNHLNILGSHLGGLSIQDEALDVAWMFHATGAHYHVLVCPLNWDGAYGMPG